MGGFGEFTVFFFVDSRAIHFFATAWNGCMRFCVECILIKLTIRRCICSIRIVALFHPLCSIELLLLAGGGSFLHGSLAVGAEGVFSKIPVITTIVIVPDDDSRGGGSDM